MGAPGQLVVNRYRLVRPLGQGRVGTVWEGHDTLLDRPVAVKEVVPPPGLGLKGQAEFIRRVTLAANTATRVNNKNLVAVYDVAEEDERPWVVMELFPSRALGSIVASEGPLPPERVADIGRRVLDALSAGHAAGLIHGDVRPANVLIGYEGRVALADLGVPATDGVPPYRAPEGARKSRAADLWSLGATLFTAAVGEPPAAESDVERAPEVLRPVLSGLLAEDPAVRIKAAQADMMLEAIAPPEPPPAPAPRGKRGKASRDAGPVQRPAAPAAATRAPAPPPARPSGRRRGARGKLIAVITGGAVVVAAVGGWMLFRPSGTSQAAAPAPSAASVSPTPAAAPSVSPSPTGPTRLPLKWYKPGTGWEAAVPKGWKREDHTDYQEWSAPDGSGHFRVAVIDWGGQDPLIVLQDAESNVSASVRSYRKIRMERIKFEDAQAAEWEARWKASGLALYPWAEKGTVYHEVRRVIWTGKTTTILTWITPQSNWAELRPTMRAAFRLYRVPEGDLLPAPTR